jgi:hypothetical protein
MNKYLVFLKNPKIWFGILLFIGIIVSIILIMKALKSTPLPETKLCPADQTKITCSDGSIKCAPICPFKDMTWNCVSGKCECTDKSANVCGDQCCTSCNTAKNACCPDEQVYKDSTGKTQCCQAGTKANIDHTSCVPACGSLTCNTDEECIIVQGLKDPHRQATIDSLNQEQVNVDSQTSSPDILYCAKRGSCGWSDETAEPSSILNNYFFHNFSKNSLDGKGNVGIYGCFPGDGSSNEDCYFKNNEQDCNVMGTSCKWKNLLDELNNDTDRNLSNFRNQMANRNKAHNRSKNGDYCQTSDVYGRYVRYTSDSPTCTVADCIRQISNNNTVQVAYKETDGIKYCGALRIPDDNGMSVTCNGVTDTGGCDTMKDITTKPTDSGWVFRQCDDVSTRISSTNCPIREGGSINKCNTQEDNDQHSNDQRTCKINGNFACADDAQFIDYTAPNVTWTVIDAPSGTVVKKTGRIAKKCDGTEPTGSICQETIPPETNIFTGEKANPPYCDTNSGYVLNNNNAEHPNSDCIYICQAKNGTALDPTAQDNNDNHQEKYYTPLQISKYRGGTVKYPPISNKYFCYRRPIDYNIPNDDPNQGNMCTGGGGDQTTQEFANNLAYQGYSRTVDHCEKHNGRQQKIMTDNTLNIKKTEQTNDNIPEFLYIKRTMQEDTPLNPSQMWCNEQGPFLLANMSDSGLYVPDVGAVYQDGTDSGGNDNADVQILCPEIANQLPKV